MLSGAVSPFQSVCLYGTKYCHYQTVLNGEEFDYIILGVGMNGHIGLNEPGVPFDEDYLQTQLDDVTINVASHKYFSGDVTLTEGITVRAE